VPDKFDAYHEPFVGGAALAFALRAAGRSERMYLSDANGNLVNTYLAVRDHTADLIDASADLLTAPTNPV
jgi:DNA adenine methylase